MAEIVRKKQKIFAGDLSASGNIAVYGSKLGGTPAYSDNLDTIQSARWGNGIMGATSSDKAPYVQDLNSIFYTITKQLAYIFQAGIPEWNSQTEYFAGKSIVRYNGIVYIAIANSTNQVPTNNAYWIRSDSNEFNSTYATLIGGYKIGTILNFNGYKIKSLIDNNTNAPEYSNIKISDSETGIFYWELVDNVTPGMIIPYAGSKIPNGWFLCNGAGKNANDYPFLFRMIGYDYGGSGDIFNLPDFRGGRIPIGESTDFVRGTLGGEKEHTLTIEEMPSHTHSLNYGFQGAGGGGQGPNTPGSISTNATGGDKAHNNMQPYTVIKGYIIKY